MVLRYRVSLPGIKGFARVYEIKDNMSLYSFARQMISDMGFPQDQIVLFKAFGADGAVSARYGVFDMGAGMIDAVTLGHTVRRGEKSFTFFYDTTNAKSVVVTYEGEVEARQGIAYPVLVEVKGPDPIEFENGYVAFEDLPDDKKKAPSDDGDDDWDDDDEDIVADEDDDDEDGKEVWGENSL